ncbi:serine hydrolase domain-containing protein [Corynebacterium uterequi]|uniref:Beta-lactamase n=1 Tax=Corynebacterium uterequi TaxID=1072256 RepID=A0A0G3HA87_9CORY|nr:serine hydrolase [Corynebacterium uterequi]AKK10229.1 Beta-lactamase [Corynebacterium uterequi]
MLKRIALAIVTIALFLAAAYVIAPRPVHLSNDRHGDQALASQLHDLAGKGHHHLFAVRVQGDDATWAGLGMDDATEFEIGSVTKTMNAQIMAAVGNPATEVGSLVDVSPELSATTFGDLANHTSGLPRLAGVPWTQLVTEQILRPGNPYKGIMPDDVLAQDPAPDPEKVGKQHYSNYGHALLGQLLAKQEGVTWEELLQRHVFAPAGMSESYSMAFGSVADDAPRGLSGDGRESAPWETAGYAPAGAVRSTGRDMTKYARFLLRHGQHEHTWVKEADHLWHNGGTGGYSAMLILIPNNDEAVFVVGDTTRGVEDIAYGLASVEEE